MWWQGDVAMIDSDFSSANEDRTVFLIPAENLEKFEAAMAKLSKRSMRLTGLPIEPFIFSHEDKRLSDGHVHRVYSILLTVDAPKIGGWTFLARIDHANEAGTIIRPVPNVGVQLPERFRTAEPVCEHCNVKRMRRDTFVLHCNEANEFKQVGSTCLADFLGHDVGKEIRRAELLGYALEIGAGFGIDRMVGGDLRFVAVEDYLRHCALMIRRYGWVSRAASNASNGKMQSTSSEAWGNMFPLREMADRAIPLTDDDKALAVASLEWARGLAEKDSKNDYEHNISVIAVSEMMEPRSSGLAASIVSGYLREQGRLEHRQSLRERTANSKHIGAVGERVELNAVVISRRSFDGNYGTVYLYRFLTEHGDVVTWFASGWQENVGDGSKVHIRGTVKKHDEYEGVHQTVLTRCKLS